jgi:2-methylcitrate dehydratase PrpD
VHDPDIRALAQRVTMSIVDGQDRRDLASTVTITLKDGRVLSRRVTEFRGTPERPLDQAGLREKFLLLTRHLDRAKMEGLFERLQQIEMEKSLDWLKV